MPPPPQLQYWKAPYTTQPPKRVFWKLGQYYECLCTNVISYKILHCQNCGTCVQENRNFSVRRRGAFPTGKTALLNHSWSSDGLHFWLHACEGFSEKTNALKDSSIFTSEFVKLCSLEKNIQLLNCPQFMGAEVSDFILVQIIPLHQQCSTYFATRAILPFTRMLARRSVSIQHS